jgi:hypothetical protein
MTGIVSIAVAPHSFSRGDAVDVRHPDVEQHEVGPRALADGAGFGSVFGQLDRMALVCEYFGEQGPDTPARRRLQEWWP